MQALIALGSVVGFILVQLVAVTLAVAHRDGWHGIRAFLAS